MMGRNTPAESSSVKNGKFTIVDVKFQSSNLIALPDKIYGRPFPV